MPKLRFVPFVFGLVVLVAVSGCSSSKSSTSPSSTTSSSTTSGPTLPGSGPQVQVKLSDTNGLGGMMTLVDSRTSVPAGDVTFVVKNTGTVDHELVVLKTDLAASKLPVVDAGDPPAKVTSNANKLDEANNVGETGDPNLKPGTSRTFTVKNMVAGNYVLVCNVADHYVKGMHAAFTVK